MSMYKSLKISSKKYIPCPSPDASCLPHSSICTVDIRFEIYARIPQRPLSKLLPCLTHLQGLTPSIAPMLRLCLAPSTCIAPSIRLTRYTRFKNNITRSRLSSPASNCPGLHEFTLESLKTCQLPASPLPCISKLRATAT